MTEPTTRARKPRSARSGKREPEKQKAGGPVVKHDGQRRGLTLDLPMLRFNVHPPSRQQVGNMVGSVAGTTRSVAGTMAGTTRWVLQPEHLVYSGALAALAAFEVIEWPVAAAMEVSLIIAERSRTQWGKAREQRPSSLRQSAEPVTA
ncbi:hypothetical protein GCM10023194_56720 [Planotetraspora phitsanulokensis]|uniref:Uncharacterized protein n=1 Tax=Planotetraspora phitsanulokensis TaxID=575192 RepID=A0A8J3UCN3_9ACTN|nr:hypothetical protein [Planotetraspora phitsanulokensis]GII43029.1 hypothetical protein Pph01_80320 [Planotetraspora phitsanulokensis]